MAVSVELTSPTFNRTPQGGTISLALAFPVAVAQLGSETGGVMSPREIILLSVLGLFVGWLYWQHYRTVHRRRTAERQWTGRALDVTSLGSRIERLRENYEAEVHSRSHDWMYREGLVASARRVLARLAFFRTRPAPASDHPSGARPA